MPSWQSRLLQLFLRLRLKVQVSGDDQAFVSFVRARFGDERLARYLTPAEASLREINEAGIKGEWVWWEGQVDEHVIFYLHGGGYIACSPLIYRPFSAELSRQAKARVFALDYRLAPEHRFPAPVEDAVAAYRWLLQQDIDPGKIIIGGDSAGGGLTIATLVALRDAGEPLPALAFCFSPWTDLTMKGTSHTTNARCDPMLHGDALERTAKIYLHDASATDPLASPLYADLTGLPTLHAFVSDTEILFDDAVELVTQANKYKVAARLHIANRQPHVWPNFIGLLPEAKQTIQEVAELINQQVKLKKPEQVFKPYSSLGEISA